jgi:hypothetical protein
MLILCSKCDGFKDDIVCVHDCGFQKSRDEESFIISNFVVLYSSVFKLYSMSLPCL